MSVQIFLTDYASTLGPLNEVYAGCFPEGCQLPVRTAVGVAALPLNGACEFTIVSVVSEWCGLLVVLTLDCRHAFVEETWIRVDMVDVHCSVLDLQLIVQC